MIVNSLVIYSGCRVPLRIPNYRPNAYIYGRRVWTVHWRGRGLSYSSNLLLINSTLFNSTRKHLRYIFFQRSKSESSFEHICRIRNV